MSKYYLYVIVFINYNFQIIFISYIKILSSMDYWDLGNKTKTETTLRILTTKFQI